MKLLKLEKYNCPTCDKVGIFLDNQEIDYEKVNVEDNPDVAAEFGVMGVPVTILLNDEGNEVKRSTGFNPEELEEMISKL